MRIALVGCSPGGRDLRSLPPALILTAEYDLLRDEGVVCAARLRAAGVPAKAVCIEGVMHGFFPAYRID